MSDNLNLNLNLDQNLNLNLNLGARGAGGGGFGPRFNTDDFPKLAPVPFPNRLTLPTRPYGANWGPEYRAWAFVRDFIANGGFGNNDPVADIIADFAAQQDFPVPDTLTVNQLAAEVQGVLHRSIKRADRALEILDQANAPGALSYWTGLLRIDASKDNATWQLILVARMIGEFVAMGLKDHYMMRRPAQVYPWIMPLIDGPDTPSYPSSHSLQAHLISAVLKFALTPAVEAPLPANQPPTVRPFLKTPQEIAAVAAAAVRPGAPQADIDAAKGAGAWAGGQAYPETAKALDVLAYRVAVNREVAGVHYPMDTWSGRYAALVCLRAIAARHAAGADPFMTLINNARTELVDFH